MKTADEMLWEAGYKRAYEDYCCVIYIDRYDDKEDSIVIYKPQSSCQNYTTERLASDRYGGGGLAMKGECVSGCIKAIEELRKKEKGGECYTEYDAPYIDKECVGLLESMGYNIESGESE